ncbi:MAG: Smr/MutS family protein [Deltaproteobacteria bacterium]|jgi:DNA mismatch repair protein MutS2|nr:Smr/MutS family protein [Deltaproteobacteria bacterium]
MDSRTLNILEFPKLLSALASCAVSEAGSAACLALRPCAHIVDLTEEADFFLQGRIWLESTGFKLSSFPSLDAVLAELDKPNKTLDLDALWTLRRVLRDSALLAKSITQEDNPAGNLTDLWPRLLECCAASPLPEKSLSALNRSISDDGYIKDEASPELLLARREIRSIHQQCARKAGDFARQYNIGRYLQDEFITLASDRYVLPLKSDFKGRLQGIIHDYSQTGETCYFEPMFLVELNNRLQDLKKEEREEERKVLACLSSLLSSERPCLLGTYKLLVRLDVLQAKHRLGLVYAGSMVDFSADFTVDLKNARHPLLALAYARAVDRRKQGAATHNPGEAGRNDVPGVSPPAPVPTDIVLKEGQRVLIISGGNAGGKTVCLKTLGLITLMGMCAMPVPVDKGSVLPVWRFVLPFIGDDQSLEDHVSTFTAQITQLAEHWSDIDRDTLVILDEFGAGTDPSQGAALAQAVIDELLEKGARVFAATHFPALKAYALSKDKVRAASVLFDPLNKKPLYKLVYEQVGASRALAVAHEHGLPETVLKRAQQYLLLDGEDTGILLERLNRLAVEREAEIGALREQSAAYAQKRAKLEEKFAAERKKLFEEIQGEAQNILRDWKSSKISHKQALKTLSRLRANVLQNGADAAQTAAPAETACFRPGQTVFYRPWNKKGLALDIDERRKRVRVDFSGVTMWAERADLSAAQGPEVESGHINISVEINSHQRLDLRGKRADVALVELERFLDSALLRGSEAIEVIHGRGTGALRREIHNYLKNNPAVKAWALAREDQGGDGVTRIELK